MIFSFFSGRLEDGLLFEFSTTTSNVLQFSPYGTVSALKPKCFLLFDQKIDRSKILKDLRVVSRDEHEIPNDELELVDEDTAKSEFKSYIDANEGTHERYVAFTFKHDLLKATQYTVRLPAGCPSAEGPLQTTSEWSASFQTYEPLKIVDWFPNTKDTCQATAGPGHSWSITFNNLLDHSTINKSLFKIEPEISGLGKFRQNVLMYEEQPKQKIILGIEHAAYDDRQITIHNNSKPNTVYTLIIQSGILKDIYGQTLEHNLSKQPIQFHVHDSAPLIGDISGATGRCIKIVILDCKFFSYDKRH
jgi:hypothetical protein